ncbi:HEXXH motif domain-containing protein [Dactylosporangium sp. CA-052675]|uniref:HEXXH motif domain-containing protein n=1 Tax=Dactylosporangium sp. CA-052675 TaxID=3239927 RepID=UPI003D8CAAD6
MLLSAEQFADIAAGYGDAGAMAVLEAGQLAKRRALIVMVLRSAGPTPFAAGTRAAADLLARAEDAHPAAVDAVLAHPHLDAWATLCLHRLAEHGEGADVDPAADLAHLAAYAVAAAVAAGIAFDIEVPVLDGIATIPGLGIATGLGAGPARARGAGTAGGVRFTGSNGHVVASDGPGWQPRRTVELDAGWRLAIEDQDPYRHCYGWQPLPTLGPVQADELAKLLGEAWRLIERDHPRHAEAMRHSLRSLVPLATPGHGDMISAASRQACGSIAVSVPDTATDLALLMLHEYMHAKLGALLDLHDLHPRSSPARLHAPWRLDPRPAGALLQGIYAHTGVTDYWRMRRHGPDGDTRRAAAQFAYWRAMNRIAIEDLTQSGELTPVGERFCGFLHDTLQSWDSEDIAADIASRTQLFVVAQMTRWLLLNARPATDETERILSFVRSGEPLGAIAGRGTVVAGPAARPADAPGLLGELHQWLDGRTEPPASSGHNSTAAGMMLLNGDAAGAERSFLERLDADAADDEAWVGLAVSRSLAAGLADRPGRVDLATRLVTTRPELLRDVVLKLQCAGGADHPASDLLKQLVEPPDGSTSS